MNAPSAPATIVAVAGRRVDAPDAAAERFPLRARNHVQRDLSRALSAAHASVLVSSAACGTDLLALEAAGTLGIRRRVVLPFEVERFRAQSVVDRPGAWDVLYDAVIAEVTARGDLVILDVGKGDDAYRRTNEAILAEGDSLSKATGGGRLAIVAWEGASRGPDDITDHFRSQAIANGWPVTEISTR